MRNRCSNAGARWRCTRASAGRSGTFFVPDIPLTHLPFLAHCTHNSTNDTHQGAPPSRPAPDSVRRIGDNLENNPLLPATLPPPGSLRSHAIATVLGLLYSTGLRIGEALALNLGDFYPGEQRLFVAAGKFHKARWIPVAPSVCRSAGLNPLVALIPTPTPSLRLPLQNAPQT